MALEVGSRLGHYEVTALIGEGGMGQVYQATDTKLNRQVALRLSEPSAHTPGLHPKIEVADVYVQQVRDTQPGDSVRIDGGAGLRRHFRTVHQEADLGTPDLDGERVP